MPIHGGVSVAWMRWILLAAGVVAYANALHAAFVYDDIGGILTRNSDFEAPLHETVVGETRPIVFLTLALNHAIGGLDPRGYHAFNILVHLVTGLAIFELIRRTARSDQAARSTNRLAFGVTLLWLVHPLNTESVTYVIQRSESMAALCIVLTLLSVERAASTNKLVWCAAALTACSLGMLTKATAVATPALALLLDCMVLSPTWRSALRRRWRLHGALLMTVSLLFLTGVGRVLFSGAATGSPGYGFEVASVTPGQYLLTQAGVILHYCRLAILPVGLCIDRGWVVADLTMLTAGQVLIVGAAAAVSVWFTIRRHPVGVAALAFFLLLAPTSSIVPIRDFSAEHRMYLPLAALLMVIVPYGARVLASIHPRAPVTTLVVSTCALTTLTVLRNIDYATPSRLWSSTLDVVPDNPRAMSNLGVALRHEGRIEDAVPWLAMAHGLRPGDIRTGLNYAAALVESERWNEAVLLLEVLAPRLQGRTQPLLLLAEAYTGMNRHEDAVHVLERAYRAKPRPTIRIAMGNAEMRAGQFEAAAASFREAANASGDPGVRASAFYNLGNVCFRLGDYPAAARAYESALDASPDHEEARRWRAEALSRSEGAKP